MRLHLRHQHDLADETVHRGDVLFQPLRVRRSQPFEFAHQDCEGGTKFVGGVCSERFALSRYVVESLKQAVERAREWLRLDWQVVEIQRKPRSVPATESMRSAAMPSGASEVRITHRPAKTIGIISTTRGRITCSAISSHSPRQPASAECCSSMTSTSKLTNMIKASAAEQADPAEPPREPLRHGKRGAQSLGSRSR